MATASASFSFQCFAMFSASGSSGFGALSRAWMLCKPGSVHLVVSRGRQPAEGGEHSPKQDGADLQRRRPLVLQDVQTDAPQL
jgi:hypothetical protein